MPDRWAWAPLSPRVVISHRWNARKKIQSVFFLNFFQNTGSEIYGISRVILFYSKGRCPKLVSAAGELHLGSTFSNGATVGKRACVEWFPPPPHMCIRPE